MIGKDSPAPTKRNSVSLAKISMHQNANVCVQCRPTRWVTTGQGAWRRRERSRTW
jgi:hypothetical protein